MKTKTINGLKVKVFEERELIEKLDFTKEKAKTVTTYQSKFPELLQEHNDNEFIIDARSLWEQLGQPQGNFADFAKRDITNNVYKEKGKKTDEKKYLENIDYIRNRNFAKGDDNGYGNKTTTEYKLTVNCAKKISLQQGNKIGDVIQDYFILMEEAIRKYEQWNFIREPQKEEYKKLSVILDNNYKSKNNIKTPSKIYMDEADMLNQILLGHRAKQIRNMIDAQDKNTRDHFNGCINKSLSEMQIIDSSLVLANMTFEERKSILEITCKEKYEHIRKEIDYLLERLSA